MFWNKPLVKLLRNKDNLFQYLIIKTWLEHIHKV